MTSTSSRCRSFWCGRSAKHCPEHLVDQRDQIGMGHPGPIVSGAGLARLVLAHLGQRRLVHFGISAAGDERGHSADGVRPRR